MHTLCNFSWGLKGGWEMKGEKMHGKLAASVIILFLFCSVSIIVGQTSPSQSNNKEKSALVIVKEWLILIDTGKYLESWNTSATIFQNAVSRDKWVQIMKDKREPFGATISRKLKESKYLTEIPGTPKGEYYVIQYETLLENRKCILVETVTVILEDNKKWKVIGYFIK
jgi:hypothetical protein